MATRKPKNTPAASGSVDGAGSILSTVSGPSTGTPPAALGEGTPIALLTKILGTATMAAAMPANPNKPAEFGDAARQPPAGAHLAPPVPEVTGSTITETTGSEKLGNGVPRQGFNPTVGPLDRVRVDSGGQVLTTNQGVAIADNQNSLKIGLRGPTALEDFIMREKITHFDHERIPERVVHARGSAAHGFFESYDDLSRLTKAAPFSTKGPRLHHQRRLGNGGRQAG